MTKKTQEPKIPPKTKSSGPAAQCVSCGDIIRSNYRHDFKHCKCGAIFVDGGSDYTRYGGEVKWLE